MASSSVLTLWRHSTATVEASQERAFQGSSFIGTGPKFFKLVQLYWVDVLKWQVTR